MSGPFVIISRSRVKPGKAEVYDEWCASFFPDVEENEPRLLAFNQWETEDGAVSVVIQVHPDAESFEYHLKLFGDRVRETFDYLDVDGVEIYGPPSQFVEEFVTHGVEAMPITVHPRHKAGFTRLQGG
jgi:uncharacterized protein YkuJ